MNQNFGTCDGYTIGKEISTMSNSKIRIAFKNQKKYVFKYLEKDVLTNNSSISTLYTNEAKVIRSLSNNNIVKHEEINTEAKIVLNNGINIPIMYLTFEYIDGKELYDFTSYSGKFSENEARFFFRQLIETLKYIHDKGYTHRDIKPQNIMIDHCKLILIDFGSSISSCGINNDFWLNGTEGTEEYMAPEMHLNFPYKGEKIDVFGSGVVLFNMISGTKPFKKAESKDNLYKYIKNNDFKSFWNIHEKHLKNCNFSSELKSLLKQMLNYDSDSRISLIEILHHPWLSLPSSTVEAIKISFENRRKLIPSDE